MKDVGGVTEEEWRTAKQAREEKWRGEAAELMRSIAYGFETMADALEENDGILGTGAGMIFGNLMPALPSHIRHTLIECLDDEAARAHRAELLYMQESA